MLAQTIICSRHRTADSFFLFPACTMSEYQQRLVERSFSVLCKDTVASGTFFDFLNSVVIKKSP